MKKQRLLTLDIKLKNRQGGIRTDHPDYSHEHKPGESYKNNVTVTMVYCGIL